MTTPIHPEQRPRPRMFRLPALWIVQCPSLTLQACCKRLRDFPGIVFILDADRSGAVEVTALLIEASNRRPQLLRCAPACQCTRHQAGRAISGGVEATCFRSTSYHVRRGSRKGRALENC